MSKASLYIGLDSSTQSLSAVVIEVRGEERSVAFETSLTFDEVLPHYGTDHGVLPPADAAVAVSSPLMWAEALDVMIGRLARSGLDLSRVVAVSGSAQQHGSVYLNGESAPRLAALDRRSRCADVVAADRADLDGFEHGGGVPRDRVGGWRRRSALEPHRFPCLRTLHWPANTEVLQSGSVRLRRDCTSAPGQLVSRVASDWSACSTRSR
jgi:hypothetical protein